MEILGQVFIRGDPSLSLLREKCPKFFQGKARQLVQGLKGPDSAWEFLGEQQSQTFSATV